MESFKVGQKIKYKSTSLSSRPSYDKERGLNEYTVLAVAACGKEAYLYPRDNQYGIAGKDYGKYTWEARTFQMELIEDVCDYSIKTIKETSMTSKMAEKFVDANTKALMDAGYLSDCLSLTAEGIAARDAAVFDLVKDTLIKEAKAKVAETKKAAK